MKIQSSNIKMDSNYSKTILKKVLEEVNFWIGKEKQLEKENTNAAAENPQLIKDELLPSISVDISQIDYTKKISDSAIAASINKNNSITKEEEEEDDDSSLDFRLRIIKTIYEQMTGKKLNITSYSDYQKAQETEQINYPTQEDALEWGYEYNKKEIETESQQSYFTSEGKIVTKDGKEINFQLELFSNYEYSQETETHIEAGSPPKKDPLVLNFNGNAAELSSMKFNFDIDSDGSTDSISMLESGSGFLVLDKNNDGLVNNGSELFGPSTGNGFQELAEYDDDGNGWIDESDQVFQNLSVWEKNTNGNDALKSLLQKNVGAIYLNSINSPFELKSRENQLLGETIRTGIFLNENESVGTVQQLDLVV